MKTALLAAAIAAIANAQTFRVAGVVVDSQHGTPLSRAHVLLSEKRVGELGMTTSVEGAFSFDVPAGKYLLSAEFNGWRLTYGTSGPAAFGSAVIVGADQETAHLTLRWYPPGAIFGRVVDDQGEPVRDATVQLILDSVVIGKRRATPAKSATTDDRGDYRLGLLAPGNYYVVATGRPWYAARMALGLRGADDQPHLATAYQPAYYRGTAETPIVLQPGAEVQADLTLKATAGGKVHLHCPGAEIEDRTACGRSTSVYLDVGGVEIRQPAFFDPVNGALSGVPPGRYTLRFESGETSAHQIVDVGAGDLDVNLTVQPSDRIVGKVAFKNSVAVPRSGVYAGIVNEATGEDFGGPIAPDGSFSFDNLGASRFRPVLYGEGGFFIAELTADGAPLPKGVVDLAQNPVVHLSILASNETGRVRGFAMNGGRPAPAVLVVLAPRAPSDNPYDYLGYQTESDGSFDYEHVRPGDYFLFAVDRLDLEYANPGALRPYLASATTLRVEPRKVYDERPILVTAAPN
ncbi:MAG: carboxypeptidase regulatory-like domain-containing protein [Bryobacteraceae bacterium]